MDGKVTRKQYGGGEAKITAFSLVKTVGIGKGTIFVLLLFPILRLTLTW